MKKKLLQFVLFTIALFGLTTMVSADVIQVEAGDTTIQEALLDALPNDIIELITSGGVYNENPIDITVDLANLTFRAAAGLAEAPIVDVGGDDLFYVTGGGISLQGIVFRNMNYGLNTKLDEGLTGVNNFKIDSCVFDGFYRCILTGDGSMTAFDSIIVTNTHFTNGDKQGMYLKRTFNGSGLLPGGYKYAKIENCLFTKITNSSDGHPIYAEPGDRTNPGEYPELLIDHCTADSTRFGFYAYCYPAATIQNCIVSNMWEYDPADPEHAIYAYPAYFTDPPPIVVENCIYSHGDVVSSNEWGEATLINVDSATALYVDAANGDYNLTAESPGKGGATDGTDIGYHAETTSTSVNSVKSELSVSAYPNPTTGMLQVSLGRDVRGAVSLEIFDVTGKRVSQMNNLNGQSEIIVDLSSARAGLYFGVLKAENSAHSFKILKK